MAIGYGTVSQCLSMYPNDPYCWDPWLSGTFGTFGAGAFGFYLGAVLAALGTIIIVGPNVARSLGKWRGAGPD